MFSLVRAVSWALVWLPLLCSCSDSDQGTDGGADQATLPGSVLITEFMADPVAALDTDGEYIELHNPSGAPVDLQGWTLRDELQDKHVIQGPLVVEPGAYLVLAVNKESGKNGGVKAAYQYDQFNLTNIGDQIVLLDQAGKRVDSVVYNTTWEIYPGISTALRALDLDNGIAGSWCPSADPWTGSAGDRGSPGAPSSCGSPPPPPEDAGPTDGLPYLQNRISFNESLCASIASGAKKITLRNGHWTKIAVGEWVKLVCSSSQTTFKAQITLVRHTTWGGITEQEYKDDGFSSQSQMLQKMQEYYPGIALGDPATVFRWKDMEPIAP
jgi:hypothetical protein